MECYNSNNDIGITVIIKRISKLINLKELDKGFKNCCFSHLKKQFLEKRKSGSKKNKKYEH